MLLSKAALLDPRMKRVDVSEQAAMASAWAEALADVELVDAGEALMAHYRSSRDPIMPADIVTLVGIREDPWADVPDLTPIVVAESRARQLEAAGVSEEEYERNRHDPAWIARTFPEQVAAVSPWARPREIE